MKMQSLEREKWQGDCLTIQKVLFFFLFVWPRPGKSLTIEWARRSDNRYARLDVDACN
jgi:hypothetical protein